MMKTPILINAVDGQFYQPCLDKLCKGDSVGLATQYDLLFVEVESLDGDVLIGRVVCAFPTNRRRLGSAALMSLPCYEIDDRIQFHRDNILSALDQFGERIDSRCPNAAF